MQRLSLNTYSIFPFLMSRNVKMSILNASSTLECQILSLKEGTEFEMLCFVNKASSSLVIVLYRYNFKLNVAFFC